MRDQVVKNGLDVMGVGVENKRSVVTTVVLRSFARRPVVAVTGGDRGFVESNDGLEVGHAEGEVHVLRRLVTRDEREGAAAVAELRPVWRVIPERNADHRRD